MTGVGRCLSDEVVADLVYWFDVHWADVIATSVKESVELLTFYSHESGITYASASAWVIS